MKIVCKNCDHIFEGNYCNFCGQSASTHNINRYFLLDDIQHGFFSFDKGILFTIEELFTRPGLAIKDFLKGKRVRYFKPISFVLVLVGIYSFIFLYFNIDVTHLSAYNEADTENASYKTVEWMTTHFAFVSLMLIPMSALSTFLAFRKKGYNYIEHIVINSYLSGLSIMIGIIFFPIVLFIPREHQWVTSGSLNIIIGNAFRFWTFYQIFSDLKPIKRIIRILLSFVYFLLIFFTVISIVSIIISSIWIFFK